MPLPATQPFLTGYRPGIFASREPPPGPDNPQLPGTSKSDPGNPPKQIIGPNGELINDPNDTVPNLDGTVPESSSVPAGSGSSSTSYTPPPAGQIASGRTKLTSEQKSAFNPMDDPEIAQAYSPFASSPTLAQVNTRASGLANGAAGARAKVEQNLRAGFEPNVLGSANTITAPTVRAPTVRSSDVHSTSGLTGANDALADAGRSRADQAGVFDTALNWAGGNMPSVGEAMASENAVNAANRFRLAGSTANQGYGTASAAANAAFGDAAAQQQFATQRAGIQAARDTKAAAVDAVRRQAALASGARANNIGLALRGAQQGAAFQTAEASRQAQQQRADAEFQANFEAANAARLATAQQSASDLAMHGVTERALSEAAAAEAAGNFQASQIASQEQQNALNLAAGISSDARSGDINTIGAATDLGQLGLGVDTMNNEVALQNAQNDIQTQIANQNATLNAAGMTADQSLAYDTLHTGALNDAAALNASVMNDQANRYQGDQQFGTSTQTQIGMTVADSMREFGNLQALSEQQLAQLMVGLTESQRQRMMDAYAIQQGQATARRGQNMQLAGGIATGLGTIGIAMLPGTGGGRGTATSGAPGSTPAGPGQNSDPDYDPYGYGGYRQSDRRSKKNIRAAAVSDFRKAKPARYEYRKPKSSGAGPGEFQGPMAQDLPKETVYEGEDGFLRVDIGRLALSLASAVGELQERA